MNSGWKVWVSRTFAGVITLALVATASLKLAHMPKMVVGLTHLGFSEGAVTGIALLELACLTLYLIPRTMVLGAVLLTGYFGGAMVVHLLGGESIAPLIVLGLLMWGGIYFRVPEIPDVMPLRRERKAAGEATSPALSTHGRSALRA